jgi:hypothetical protein
VGVGSPRACPLGRNPTLVRTITWRTGNTYQGSSGNDVGRYKIDLGFGVGTDAVSVAADAHLIKAVATWRRRPFICTLRKPLPPPHDEIIGMVVTIGFSHHESEGDGFVNKGSFPEIALVINRFPSAGKCLSAKRPWLCSWMEVEVSGKWKGAPGSLRQT